MLCQFPKHFFIAAYFTIFSCSKSTIETLEKGEQYVQKPTIETLEKGVKHAFIVNFEHFTPFSNVSIVSFEQVIVSWETLMDN